MSEDDTGSLWRDTTLKVVGEDMLGAREDGGGLGMLNYGEGNGYFLCRRRREGEDIHDCGVGRAVHRSGVSRIVRVLSRVYVDGSGGGWGRDGVALGACHAAACMVDRVHVTRKGFDEE